MEKFVKNDKGYHIWLNKKPNGFVLNANNPPNARYLIAHRASCHSIIGTPSRGKIWTQRYIKVCGETLHDLKQWTLENFNREPHCCRHCSPDA